MWEVSFVRKANDLALATSHLAQSSSASRYTAKQPGFFILSQRGKDKASHYAWIRSPQGPFCKPARTRSAHSASMCSLGPALAVDLAPGSRAATARGVDGLDVAKRLKDFATTWKRVATKKGAKA